jgi:catechol 2,3-dioxygenase-like lactoylglutathione lyase family enzyme
MRLHHVAVICNSQENADRFYGNILGLRKIKATLLSEDFADAIFHIAQKCAVVLYGNENMVIEVFVPESPAENKASFVHLCLEVENRQEFARKCQNNNLTVNRVEKADSLLIFVSDYDGNLFEVKEAAA